MTLPAVARSLRASVVIPTFNRGLRQPDWLDRITGSVCLQPPTAAGGRTLNALPDNPCAATAQLILDMGERDQRKRNYGPLFYPTNNLAFGWGFLGQKRTGFRSRRETNLPKRREP
jgi:hypothetical protein